MALEVEISGLAGLKQLVARLETESGKGLGREMSAALRKVSKPLQAAVEEEYATGLPTRGDYVNTFTRSIKWRTGLRSAARSASFRLTIFGEGEHERRDIKALEAGNLRHPVYGRSRRIRRGVRRGSRDPNPWAVSKVVGGYFRRGTDSAADATEREMDKVLADFAGRLK